MNHSMMRFAYSGGVKLTSVLTLVWGTTPSVGGHKASDYVSMKPISSNSSVNPGLSRRMRWEVISEGEIERLGGIARAMANLTYQNTGTNAWSLVLVNGIALNSLTNLMKQLMRSAAPPAGAE